VEFRWLEEIRNIGDKPLSVEQMRHLGKVIKRFQLPCQLINQANSTSLHIHTWNVEPDPPHVRPIRFLTIYDHQVPRGHMYHPQHGTIGKSCLMAIAVTQENKALCKEAGISPGTLRPGSIHQKRI